MITFPKKITGLLLFLIPLVALPQGGPIIRNPVTTNAFMNQPQNGWIAIWNNVAQKWSNGVNTASATNDAQPPSTVLSNLTATGVSPGATNASAYIASLSGLGSNTHIKALVGTSRALLVNTNVLVVTNGNVGIGTDAPAAKLEVNGTATFKGAVITEAGLIAAGGSAINVISGGDSLGFDVNTPTLKGISSNLEPLVIGSGTNHILELSTNTSRFKSNLVIEGRADLMTARMIGGQTASRALVLDSSTNITTATGTPDGTKFLRDDNTYAVPPGGSATPGGNSGAVQFNEGGSFAGTNRFLYDRTNEVLSLVGGSAGTVRLYDSDSSHGVNLIGNAALSSNLNLTFPHAMSNGLLSVISVNDSNFNIAVIPEGTVPNNSIGDAELRQSVGVSVIGRSANTTGNAADIAAAANGYMLWRSNSVLQFAKGEWTNSSFANLSFSNVMDGQAPAFHNTNGLLTNRSLLSETIGPHLNTYWDDFYGRPMHNETNLGFAPSGQWWHMVSAEPTNRTGMSNGVWRPIGLLNTQTPWYVAISNGVAGSEYSRVGGKLRTVFQPAGFTANNIASLLLSDNWPTFNDDPFGLHIVINYDQIYFQKWPGGPVMHTGTFDGSLSLLDTTVPFEVQWVSNTVWYTVGQYNGTFTDPDWHLHSRKNFTIYRGEVSNTNSILTMWDGVWGGYAYPERLNSPTDHIFIPTNSALSNIVVDYSFTGTLFYYLTNNITLTNRTGLAVGRRGTKRIILQAQLIPRGINHGFGIGYRSRLMTNAPNHALQVVTNGTYFVIDDEFEDTNVTRTVRVWQ